MRPRRMWAWCVSRNRIGGIPYDGQNLRAWAAAIQAEPLRRTKRAWSQTCWAPAFHEKARHPKKCTSPDCSFVEKESPSKRDFYPTAKRPRQKSSSHCTAAAARGTRPARLPCKTPQLWRNRVHEQGRSRLGEVHPRVASHQTDSRRRSKTP